jgi:hypothetical protein
VANLTGGGRFGRPRSCCRTERVAPEDSRFSHTVITHVRLAIEEDCAWCLAAHRPRGSVWAALSDQLVRDRIATLGFLGEWLRATIHQGESRNEAFASLTTAVRMWPGPGSQTKPTPAVIGEGCRLTSTAGRRRSVAGLAYQRRSGA